MENVNPQWLTFLATLLIFFMSFIGYFLKQLHADFKRMNFDMVDVKSFVRMIEQKLHGNYELMERTVEFLEKRVAILEKKLSQKENNQSN